MKEQKRSPVFHSAVLLVEDVKKSKRFYSVVLGQKIVFDFGRNVIFEGGLSIWDRGYALDLIFGKKRNAFQVGIDSAEFYFETRDLEKLFERLSKEEVEFIHSIREEPWGQRIFRVFDCDGHILEFAESMESVVFRLDEQGLDVNEIASKSKMPLNFINSILSNKK